MDKRTAGLWFRQVFSTRVVRILRRPIVLAALLWRRLLFRTTFIAITGSLGKTTTKEALADILDARGRTYRSIANQNRGLLVAMNVLRVRPWHRFAVIEIGVGGLCPMRIMARVVRPDAAIIVNVRRTHTGRFASLEACAAEKAELLQWVRPGGSAVLNGDDPLVAAMSVPRGVKVIKAGCGPSCGARATEASSCWPERLRFRVEAGGESCEVRTRQVGLHWVPALTAAIVAAASLGCSLGAAAQSMARSQPFPGRMDPVSLPNGAVLLRDDYSTSMDGLEPALRMLEEAQAERRCLLITDFSDSGMNRHKRLRHLAARVAGRLDLLVLAGDESVYGRRKVIECGMAPDAVHACATLKEAAALVKQELRAGDLMLLEGRTTEHVTRVFFAQFGTVN